MTKALNLAIKRGISKILQSTKAPLSDRRGAGGEVGVAITKKELTIRQKENNETIELIID
jgi:hypothetical protein